MKNKTGWIVGGVIAFALVLILIGGGGGDADAGNWADTEVACLAGGHQGAITHIHSHLSVFVDGEEQSIPADVGINAACMAEVHTHDATGEIHIETPGRGGERTLADFFAVWDQPLTRSGFEREITVNGQEASPEYVFADGDEIEVRFTSTSTSTEATTTEEETEMTTTTTPAS